jgi:hypothetical protein
MGNSRTFCQIVSYRTEVELLEPGWSQFSACKSQSDRFKLFY